MEGLFQPFHLLMIFFITFFGLLVFWPVARILSRAGFNGAWCLLMIVPILNLIAVWVFAYAKWPALRESSSATR